MSLCIRTISYSERSRSDPERRGGSSSAARHISPARVGQDCLATGIEIATSSISSRVLIRAARGHDKTKAEIQRGRADYAADTRYRLVSLMIDRLPRGDRFQIIFGNMEHFLLHIKFRRNSRGWCVAGRPQIRPPKTRLGQVKPSDTLGFGLGAKRRET